MKRSFEYDHDFLFHTVDADEFHERVEVHANSYSSTVEWTEFPWSVSIHTSVSSIEDCTVNIVGEHQ